MINTTKNKCRLCRREGVKLFVKGDRCSTSKCPIERKGAVPPGMGGVRGTGRRLSEYGRQLREKQKAKRLYGVSERQFSRYFAEARKEKKATGQALMQLLETRLDNILFRLAFFPSRSAARQIVSHGHVLVNGKRVDVPSYRFKEGQVVSLDGKAIKISSSLQKDEEKLLVPEWLARKGLAGKMKRLPERDEIEAAVDEQSIIEYYSR